MSDTPTAAEEVIEGWFLSGYRADYLAEYLNSGTVPDDSWEPHAGMRSQARANAEQLAALIRSSPAALADLNGGEWVQPNNGVHSAWWHDTEPSDEDPPSAVWRCEGFPVNAPPNDNPPPGYRPMFVFVPREATDGSN